MPSSSYSRVVGARWKALLALITRCGLFETDRGCNTPYALLFTIMRFSGKRKQCGYLTGVMQS